MEEPVAKIKTVRRVKRERALYAAGAMVVFVAAIVAVTTITSSKVSQPVKPLQVAQVRITKTGFEPATLVVKQGAKIIWTNDDGTMHQVASNPYPKDTGLANLKSEILNNEQTYEYTANTAGNFGYHDQLKPTINATLVVVKQ